MSNSVPDGWKSVKLDEVAEERSDRVDNPSKSGYDRFVGLEHLDSGELTVRRWGSTTDLLSAMKLFKSGDILIGRRNAYLKRASKAEFDGVCSGDAYVVREKKGKLAEGLLPVILNSDSFWDYTIAHASGTMSKRAKWRDLAEYTFLLPSLEEQRRIATTLWAAEDCLVKGENFIAATERVKQALTNELFGCVSNNALKCISRPSKFIKIGEICEIKGGLQKTQDRVPKNNPVRYLTVIHVQRNFISYDESRFFEVTPRELDELRLLSGDVLTVEGNGNKNEVGRTAIFRGELEDCVHQNHVIRIRPNKEKLDSEFLNYYLNSSFGQKVILKQSMSTSGLYTLSVGRVKNLEIPYLPLPEQRQIADILTRCDEMIAAARANVAAVKALKMKMINEMLMPQISE